MSLQKYFTPSGAEKEIAEQDTCDFSTDQTSNIESDYKQESEATNDESDSKEAVQAKRRKRNKTYKQKFKAEWVTEDNNDWLYKNEGNEAACRVCKNKSLVGGISHITRHAMSKSHHRNLKALKITPKIKNILRSEATEHERLKLKTGVKKELKMLMFVAEHNLALSVLDHLPQLISSICYDSEVAKSLHCARKKGTDTYTQIIATENLQCVASDLKKNYFSLIIDETTDISSLKCLAIVVRYFKNDQVQDLYFGMVEVEDATAQSLFTSVKQLIEENEIPLSQMIGFAADNASVMQGNKNGVQAIFQREIPNLFVLGCVCHSLALCSSSACKKLPQSVECLARDIVSYFSHSSKRLHELKEYQQFAEIKPHKLLRLSQTRWLSLQAVVDRILEQWGALTLFFTNESFDTDHVIDPKAILGALNDVIFKLYFSFLSYVLEIVNKINIEFQSQRPKICLLYTRVETLFRSILNNFIKAEQLKSKEFNKIQFTPSSYKTLTEIYCGANCEVVMTSHQISKADLEEFQVKCLSFYIELSNQILSRFDFSDPILKFLNNFEPVVAMSGNCESLVPLAMRFPKLVKNFEHLNTEWRTISASKELQCQLKDSSGKVIKFETFWSLVFNLKNGLDEYMFPNLTFFLKGIFALPHSSATAERIFSQLTLIKTKNRNSLNVKTCDALLHTKNSLGSLKCFQYEPSNSLVQRTLGLQPSESKEVEITF